jgi:hypothetical protein
MRIFVVMIAAFVMTAPAGAADRWQTFKDPSGVFSVEVPNAPDKDVSAGSNLDGTVKPPSTRYMATDGPIAFIVSVTDYSQTWMQPENAVEGAADGITHNGTVLSDTTV